MIGMQRVHPGEPMDHPQCGPGLCQKDKIYARTTTQGTAASETATCGRHRPLSPQADDTTGEPVDCTGNPELACVVCGYRPSVT